MWNARKGLLNKGNTITDRIVHIVLHTDDWSVLSSSMSGNVRTDERVSGFAHMIPFSNDCVDKTRPFCRTTISFGGYNLPYYCGGDWDYCAEEDGNVQVWVPEAGVAVEGHEIPFNPWITSWRKSDSTVRSVLGVRNRFFRDYSPAAKIKAVEDLYGEAVEFAHQRDRRRYKPVSKYLQQHSTAFPTLYLVYQYLFCQPASSAAVERSFSVQGCFMLGRRNGKCYKKNTFDKLAREIAAELGKIPRVIQPILFVVQG